MADALREYDGLLWVEIPPRLRAQIEALSGATGVAIEIDERSIELRYRGRDSSRFVVALLARLAALIGDAEGEITCETEDAAGARVFEFYRIAGGRLLRQRGAIVRGPVEQVDPARAKDVL